MNGRVIVIGDIHGCREEFSDLLEKVEFHAKDRLVLLGDLVNRGPDSRGVIRTAKAAGAISLLGNHELRLLKYRKSGDKKYLKNDDQRTLDSLEPEDWAYLESMLITWEEPAYQTVCVHGGFLPNEPWKKQPPEVVTRIQVIDEQGRPRKRADATDSPAWADLWKGPPFVVYGHTPRPAVYSLEWSLGIDTGCVMGGHLTAYILPEKRLVQVRAKRRYDS